MASWHNAKQTWLMTQLTRTEKEPIKDLEKDFLYSQLSVTEGDITRLWQRWLISRPQVTSTEGAVQDLWDEYLTALGYTGSVREKQIAFWEA